MTEKKTLYLHIGQTKTGSTALQAFLHAHRAALLERGVLYPHVPPDEPIQAQHRFLVQAMHASGGSFDDAGPAWRYVTAQIDSASQQVAILSEEVFWHLFEQRPPLRAKAIEWLSGCLTPYNVRVVCYLRPQDEWIQSWFSQIVRTDVTKFSAMRFEEFLEHHAQIGILDYANVLDDWARAFGKESLMVRTFERERLAESGDIVADFCQLTGIGDVSKWVRPEASQPRLGVAALEMVGAFNRAPRAAEHKPAFMAAFLREFALPSDCEDLLGANQAAQLMERYAAGNDGLAEVYCNRSQLFLTRGPRVKDQGPQGLRTTHLADVIARVFIVQQRQIRSLRREMKRLQAAVEGNAAAPSPRGPNELLAGSDGPDERS